MRKFGMKLSILCVLISVTATVSATQYAVINPNDPLSPESIRNLKVSFRLNDSDVIAPNILFSDDGTLAFVNYIASDDGDEDDNNDVGYVLVFHPREWDPAKQFVKAIKMGRRPALMYYNPTHTEIWVLNFGNFGTYPDTQCSVTVIDTATLEVKTTIDASTANFGFGSNIVFTSDGTTAYVSSSLTGEILKFDALNHTITNRLKVECSACPYYYTAQPTAITLSHDETFLCVSNALKETVSVVDLATFTERHQVSFWDPDATVSSHTPNLSFRSKVLLSPDDKIGFVSSVGSSSAFGIVDRVYLFDPATGKPLEDEDENYITLPVPGEPTTVTFDPTGKYIVIQNVSYDEMDDIGTNLKGYASFYVYTYPDLAFYKSMTYSAPDYNMCSMTDFAFIPNDQGEYDILFPAFSSYNMDYYSNYKDTVVRVPMNLYKQTTAITVVNNTENREMPVTMAMIPGSGTYLVADYVTGKLVESAPPSDYVFTSAMGVKIADKTVCSLALLNPYDVPVSYWLQSFQTNDTNTSDDDARNGYPFFWVDSDKVTHIIEPYEITLPPGQQLISDIKSLIPDYDKVSNQHGFMKASNETLPLHGVVFNATLNDSGAMIRGDYFRIGGNSAQDMIFPCLYSNPNTTDTTKNTIPNIHTYLHYVNPYLNVYSVNRIQYLWDGSDISNGSVNFDVNGAHGIDQAFGQVLVAGFVRCFNTANLETTAYQTVEGQCPDASFLYTVPPLDPLRATSTFPLHVPYFAVGAGFDTTLHLVDEKAPYIDGVVDSSNNPIRQYTHVRIDFYDLAGNLFLTKELDIKNHSEYMMALSDASLTGHGRYADDVLTGSIVITVNQDQVCGAYSISYSNAPTATLTDPLTLIRNMSMDSMRFRPDAALDITYPFAVNLAPYYTAYILNNPGDAASTVHVDIYNPDGTIAAQSLADIQVPAHGQYMFSMTDSWLFDPIPNVDNFMGYLKLSVTNGQPIFSVSMQGTSELVTFIPSL